MTLTPAQRSLRGRIGAYALHARRDARETTRIAREKFLERFEREVDPAGELPTEERRRRAEAARRAYFTRLALRSARRRSGRGVDVPATVRSPSGAGPAAGPGGP